MTAVLEIRDLWVETSSGGAASAIVRGVSITLARSEVLGLIGESGAGKSTIGLAALGYARKGCRLARGSIRLNGEELLGAPDRRLRQLRGARVAYVAQSAAAAFNPAHRLEDQIIEPAVVHGILSEREARAEARRLCARLGLSDPEAFGRRYPHQVSGGQLQRAMTVMALLPKPDLVVFDEPTTALDVTTQIEVLAAIRLAIEAERLSALYISHDLALVAQIAHRILVLRDGREIECGPTDAILNRATAAYTRALVEVRRLHRPERPPPAGPPLLSVEGVDAAYGHVPVLHRVSLTVPAGRTVAVVGESGSGKSTLARVITGLLPPSRGEVRLDGTPLGASLRARSREQLRAIQLIHQMPDVALNPRQRVGQIIGRVLAFYFGVDAAHRQRRVAELLEQVELPADFANRYPDELSGGQKQRVCIARALAARPRLLVCDEPTSALDVQVADAVLRLLLRLQEETGIALLFVTHDLATVKAIADEIVVMHRGRVVERGTKSEILTPPHHPYTELLLSSVPEMTMGWLDGVLAGRRARQARRDGLREPADR
ncbi:Glutathione import ATP-binding protein GsiA [bacterium HR40]|nr:Glutathione import ATP-binding protein GsiA [bacterium HR40]